MKKSEALNLFLLIIVMQSMLLLLLCSSSASSSSNEEEAQLLLQFKQALNLESASADMLQDWDLNVSSSLCSWTGVICDSTFEHVVSVSLSGLGLSGSISASLGLLPFLTSIDLSHNLLSGTIPPSLFSNATHLSNLTLSYNFLSGPIPLSISSCSSLAYLDLQSNFLNQTLPPTLALLPRLRLANFAFNRLHGTIPSFFSNCTHLVSLHLEGNSFHGRLPSSLCSGFSNLQLLDLSYNPLTGAIPAAFLLNCTQLSVLALEGCNLVGSIPREIANLWRLEEIWMSNNSFSGMIPYGMGNLSHLQVLDLSVNNLSGRIPKDLGELSNMSLLLDVSSNSLDGTLPIFLSNLTSLQILRMSGNRVIGAIPMEYHLMVSLTNLELNDNLLNERIPGFLFANRSSPLVQVLLHNNQLSGRIPWEIGRLSQLRVLYLHGNLLEGAIPDSLSNCSALQDLSLGHNRLIGSIPSGVAGLRSVMYGFSMASNLLTGVIPKEIGLMAGVNHIDLSGNNLTGAIPESLGGCAALQSLILSHNNLQGRIPENLSNIQSLTVLDLSGNRLSGEIPIGLAFLRALSYFDVSENNLTGPIPEFGQFKNFTAKSFLNNSGLCGTILAKICHGAPASSPPFLHQSSSRNMKLLKKLEIGISVIIAFAAITTLAGLLLIIFVRIHRRNTAPMEPPESPLNVSTLDLSNIGMKVKLTPKDVLNATQGFSQSNVIGMGSSSIVYRGTLPGGKGVAVKKLKMEVRYPSEAQRSFLAELWVLGKARHRNLVQVLGYCSHRDWKALILELMPNGSLETKFQEGGLKKWEDVLRLAKGIVEGLVYLHDECVEPIVHSNLKPTNILLDSHMEPHVADFGLARILELSNMTSKGYVAPETLSGRRPTTKSDVYSFGVILMEMITQYRIMTPHGKEEETSNDLKLKMVKSVKGALTNEKPLEVVDIEVLKSACLGYGNILGTKMVMKMLEIAFVCTQDRPNERPTMKQVKDMILMKSGDLPLIGK